MRCGHVVCSRCDRGQRNCRPVCRKLIRLDQHRRANRLYRSSPEARMDHRDRQREYRRRCRTRTCGMMNDPKPMPAIMMPRPSPRFLSNQREIRRACGRGRTGKPARAARGLRPRVRRRSGRSCRSNRTAVPEAVRRGFDEEGETVDLQSPDQGSFRAVLGESTHLAQSGWCNHFIMQHR